MWDKNVGNHWHRRYTLPSGAPALTGRRCCVWWRNPTKMKTRSRLESGCVSKKSLSCSWEQALCWSRWKRGVSRWGGALRSAHSPGFGAVCRGWGGGVWAGDSENAGVLRLKRVCKCSRQLMHHRKEKKKKSFHQAPISYSSSSIIRTMSFFIPNTKGL